MCDANDIESRLIAVVPHLRAFARSLCGDATAADDLVQDALLMAWSKRDTLHDIEKLRPWIFTIIRNVFLASKRRKSFAYEDVETVHAEELCTMPPQLPSAELADVERALGALPFEEREALALVCIEQLSYHEAAVVCGCPTGTMKSRVNRGRRNLLRELGEPECAVPTGVAAKKGAVARHH